VTSSLVGTRLHAAWSGLLRPPILKQLRLRAWIH